MFRPKWPIFIVILLILLFVQLAYYLFKTSSLRSGCEGCPKQETIKVVEESKAPQKATIEKKRRIVVDSSGERARAAIVILARNTDFEGLNKTIPMFEERFNSKFNYPYVFLNDVPFTEVFKSSVGKLSKSKMSFGHIPKEQWSYPDWVNVTKADECREDMRRRDIIYGGSLPYRHMCRFNSGFFFRHPLLDEYEFYWRVEPSVEFFCDIDYDPFLFMKKNDKKYGFVIMLHEYKETIPTLWETTKRFMDEKKELITDKNSLKLIQKDDGSYNNCHFWSNFEIASLDFLRSKPYLEYFDYLDKAGGFFYERWGDAPVHSIGAAMFLPIEQIHYFEDVGYFHNPFYNCPANPALQLQCKCDSSKNVNNHHECFRIYRQVSNKFSY
jgi:alpha 1,2-mannosyltransferase